MAVSPIVVGAALKGPADRLLVELGGQASSPGVARFVKDWVGTLVIDQADADPRGEVEAAGVNCIVAPTVMRTPEMAAGLARIVLGATGKVVGPPASAPDPPGA